ncbi:hypothetical protein ACERJO_20835 [Halalkalibacter sp. AB-rgal2]|uniref:hypothetical protein n=1 Tax=Halalkalibacter sp. AB-rgal2 TaxID=3242695 RepID=UPI00359F0DB3
MPRLINDIEKNHKRMQAIDMKVVLLKEFNLILQINHYLDELLDELKKSTINSNMEKHIHKLTRYNLQLCKYQ